MPLGKGYFDISFREKYDKKGIWFIRACSLPYGIMRLTQWIPNYIPGVVAHSFYTQVQIRLYGLGQEF